MSRSRKSVRFTKEHDCCFAATASIRAAASHNAPASTIALRR